MKVDIGLLIPKSGNPLLIGKPQAKGFVKEDCLASNCYEKYSVCIMQTVPDE